MREFRYPVRALAGDYARAGVGLLVTLGPLLFVPASPVMMVILGGLAALFLAFGARTALRQWTVVRMDDAGIVADGLMRAQIAWSELEGLALAYYSTRRDRTRGWMQVTMKGRGSRLRIDSTIDGFGDIVRAATRHADRRGLELSPATMGNLAAMGIDGHGGDRPMETATGGPANV